MTSFKQLLITISLLTLLADYHSRLGQYEILEEYWVYITYKNWIAELAKNYY